MIAFRDFSPRNLDKPGFSKGVGEWEPLSAALAAANEWIASEGIEVLNVETVVLPCHPSERAFSDSSAPAAHVNGGNWHVARQVVRVWHRASPL